MTGNINRLEISLGYKFRNLGLLERAVTHRSSAHEAAPSGSEVEVRKLHNESLEFIGDSVLGLAVAEELFSRHPDKNEGDLTLMKHQLVSADTLSRLCEENGFSEFLRLGKGEAQTGGRTKRALLADLFEAIIGAVFLDSGYVPARELVIRLMRNEIKSATPQRAIDSKTLLQERLQAEKLAVPVYSVEKTIGPPHERTFFVMVKWDGGEARGEGTTIKHAEMEAARNALETIG